MGSGISGRNKDFIQKELIPEIQQTYGNDSVTMKTYTYGNCNAVKYTFKLPDAEDNPTRLDTLVAAVQHISDNLLPIKSVSVCTWHRRRSCSFLMKCTAVGYGPVFAASAFALVYHPRFGLNILAMWGGFSAAYFSTSGLLRVNRGSAPIMPCPLERCALHVKPLYAKSTNQQSSWP
jgi:hypothetical protein